MKQIKTVALDIDDVLAGFFSGISAHYGIPEIKCDIWDGKDVNKWISEVMIAGDLDNNHRFWLGLDPISTPNSIDFEVAAYITSSPESVLEWRKLWLEIAGFPIAPVVHCKNKIETMERLGIDVLVDDSPKTCKAINDNSGPELAIQFVPPYMSVIADKELAITHLSEVKNFLI